MSIATIKQLQQQSIHKPIRHQQQGSTTFNYNQQQLERYRKKSIESEVEVGEHVTEKIKKSKQLLRQTPVALIEAEVEEQEVKTEIKKAKSQSQESNNKIFKGIEDNYSVDLTNGELKDYKIYQNGKVNEFFKNDLVEKPQKISDICLVNDHYILVKMPEQESSNNTSTSPSSQAAAAAATRRQEFKALKEHNERILKESEKQENKQFRRQFLRCKRNRITRITPIREEPEDCSDCETKTQTKLYCLKMQSCWQVSESDQIEIYDSQTKIHKSLTNSPQQQLTPGKLNAEKSSKINDKKSLDIQTISGDIFKSSPLKNPLVNLHSYGSLMENANNNNNNNLEIIKSPQRRKCPRFESFYWLLRPFRGKYRKTKPKIQAVVYKTYFVKWTKPPDTLSHGYGVKSPKSSEMEVSVLRRCRSAIF